MEENRHGWVIANYNHPRAKGVTRIYPETFAYTRTQCISKFIEGSGSSWKWWKRKYNFVAVKATMKITIEQPKHGT